MTNTQTKTPKTYEDKIAQEDLKIQQHLNRRKKLLQKQKEEERKQRTSRLIRRQALMEMFMKELATFTDDQFETFIRTGINTTYGRNKITEIIEKGAEHATAYIARCRSEEEARKKEAEKNKSNGNSGNAEPPKAEQSGA